MKEKEYLSLIHHLSPRLHFLLFLLRLLLLQLLPSSSSPLQQVRVSLWHCGCCSGGPRQEEEEEEEG